ncbi:hypothetical protein VPH35_061544 [Triticum aestivum]
MILASTSPICRLQLPSSALTAVQENWSNTIAMGARPGFHIFFGSSVASADASPNFAGRPSAVVPADFAPRASEISFADFAGRSSVNFVVNRPSAYFTAAIFDLQLEFTDGYRMKNRAYRLQDFE